MISSRPLGLGVCPRRSSVVKATASGDAAEIYIGFPKGDYDRPAGRKGRVIKDDPKKYPGREDLGFFLGAVGGWAGGEAGLWQLRDKVKAELASSSADEAPLAPASPIREPSKSKWGVKPTSSVGKDAIYVGFSKDEIELRKTGIQGRVIYDDAFKYPGREDMGPLHGIVGGFAGGEAALKHFAVTGELKIRQPGDPSIKKQFSPLVPAFMVMFAACGGAALLTVASQLVAAQVTNAATH